MQKVPFSPREMAPTCEAPMGGMRNPPGYSTPVMPKENYLSALRRQGALWIPFTEDMISLTPRIIADNPARGFDRDLEQPLAEDQKGGKDLFGVEWTYVPEVFGSTVRPGNPILTDVTRWQEILRFPDLNLLDWARCARVNAGINATRRALTATIVNGLFERLISFMDFEPAAIALIDEEQESAVHALFSRLCDLYEQMIDRYTACFRLDGIVFHDDWGSQRAPFFSPATCRKMLMPYIRRLADFCHARGLLFQLHSCGKNEPLVPLMIEAGVDIWSPQAMNDMDFLFSAYGDKLVFALTPGDVPQDAPESEAELAARAIVRKYAPHFPEKPVIIATNHISTHLADKIYELSREALCGRESGG